MSTNIFLSQEREIQRLGVRTPLIVPSFSSRGFSEVGQMLHLLRDDLYGICLVSAFDVARQHVQTDLADITDMLIVDSGVYETSSTIVSNNLHSQPVIDGGWTRTEYRALLSGLTDETNMLVVNFDHYGALQEQVDLAREDFACRSEGACDFLLKPQMVGGLIDVPIVLDQVEALVHFDVIGVTEKELGSSLIERCRALRALRQGLNAAGIYCPIHVFGSITPGVITSYFLSGADIFDGLNWLRYDYAKPGLTCIFEPAIDDSLWAQSDAERYLNVWRRNLSILHALQKAMHRCAKNDGTLEDLITVLPDRSVIEAAARAATVAIEK